MWASALLLLTKPTHSEQWIASLTSIGDAEVTPPPTCELLHLDELLLVGAVTVQSEDESLHPLLDVRHDGIHQPRLPGDEGPERVLDEPAPVRVLDSAD